MIEKLNKICINEKYMYFIEKCCVCAHRKKFVWNGDKGLE